MIDKTMGFVIIKLFFKPNLYIESVYYMHPHFVKKPQKISCILLATATVCVFLFFYLLVRHTPMVMDDYNYTFHWGSNGFNKTVFDIFDSLVTHYMYTNGRIVLHFFVFLFCMVDKVWFNLSASLCFCALGWLVAFHCTGSFRKIRPHALLLVYMGYYLLTPSFADSFLWIAGSCNYLFSLVIVLTYLIPWRRALAGKLDSSRWLYPSMLIGGVLAGWTNENLCLALITIQIGFLIVFHIRKIAVKPWMMLGLVGSVVGAAAMLLAPGNMVRAGGSLGGISTWIRRILPITKYMVRNFWQLMVVCLILLVLLCAQELFDWKQILAKLTIPIVFLFASGIAVYSMCVVEEAPDRTWSIMLTMFLLTVGSIYEALDLDKLQMKAIGPAFLTALLLMGHFPAALKAVDAGWYQNQERMAFISRQIGQGNLDLICPEILVPNTFSVFRNSTLSDDPESWQNVSFAHRLGLNSIRIGDSYDILHP